ncbi:MAG: outer membrane lipoprotein chaperone LolA [Thermodesulfobacteriota bacterium]
MAREKYWCLIRMINILKNLLLLLAILVMGSALADDAQTQLKSHLDRLDSFSANFSQRLINTEQVTVEPSLGRMMFKRPGQFRWIYETPYEQEIISNGETLWIYDKDLEQVTIRAAGEGLDRLIARLAEILAEMGK